MEKRFEPTYPAPLPYPGAPLTIDDMIKQQANFDEHFYPAIRIEEKPDPVAMRKEIPSGKPAKPFIRNWGLGNVARFMP